MSSTTGIATLNISGLSVNMWTVDERQFNLHTITDLVNQQFDNQTTVLRFWFDSEITT